MAEATIPTNSAEILNYRYENDADDWQHIAWLKVKLKKKMKCWCASIRNASPAIFLVPKNVTAAISPSCNEYGGKEERV